MTEVSEPGTRRDGSRPAAGRVSARSWPMSGGLAAVVLWGLAPVATRAAVAHLAALPLLVLRLTAAALVLLPWATPAFRQLRLRSLGRLIAAGLLGLIGYNLPVTLGLQWIPAARAGLLLATEPIWVMILATAFLGERSGLRAWLGSAAAVAGVAALAGPAALTGAGGARALAGAGLVLAGTLAFAAYTIVLRPLSQNLGAIPATAASVVVGAVPYLAFAGTLSMPRLAHLGAPVWGELAFLALGSTVAGMLLWNRAVLSGGTTRVSLLLYLEPLVSVAGAVALLGEHLTLASIGGGVLILAGVAASSITRPRRLQGPEVRWEDAACAGRALRRLRIRRLPSITVTGLREAGEIGDASGRE
jgi:drug/metabolite transporter (DMT)-like permease